MIRILLIVLCLLVFPWTPCQSAENVQLARMNPWVAGSVTASSCSSGDNDQGYSTTSTNSNSTLRGQSFQVDTAGYKYSIKLDMLGAASETVTITLRYGNGLNLDTYWGEVQKEVTFVNGVAQTVEFVLNDTIHSFATSTTYYFMIHVSGGTVQHKWYYSVTGSYANGVKYATTASDWDLTGHSDPSHDFSFQIVKCGS